jgi:hypothetical protein
MAISTSRGSFFLQRVYSGGQRCRPPVSRISPAFRGLCAQLKKVVARKRLRRSPLGVPLARPTRARSPPRGRARPRAALVRASVCAQGQAAKGGAFAVLRSAPALSGGAVPSCPVALRAVPALRRQRGAFAPSLRSVAPGARPAPPAGVTWIPCRSAFARPSRQRWRRFAVLQSLRSAPVNQTGRPAPCAVRP